MQEPENNAAPRRRPLGITLIALLLALQGVLSLFVAIVSLLAMMRTNNALNGMSAILTLVIGLICLALAWGLWRLKRWAFIGAVALQIVSIVYTLLLFVLSPAQNTLGTTITNLILPVVVLIYLFVDKNVRAAFRPEERSLLS